eukprot:CAMPEP_0171963862 /NCGR_PEP_ID=MMETSP0993-20121228/178362_1 /TAXON_ID=483369 /ORGANISM="non described non described, Strain CCMP2098" /LENGTH=209 /DNA_ID=CAMNT_0012612571 /DNA_START=26 /DNA_END=651 /DNA_ORIENTATION=+
MAQAQRVVAAISTILPKLTGGPYAAPPRFMKEQEASQLASVCEDWLRSVATEEWSGVLLNALPEVTAACLNALLLSMLEASQNPVVQPRSAGGDSSGGAVYSSAPSPARGYYESPRADSQNSGANQLSLSVGSEPGAPPSPGALEMLAVLKRSYGNRATEMLGAMGAIGSRGSQSITSARKKSRSVMLEDCQLGLANLGLHLPEPTLRG